MQVAAAYKNHIIQNGQNVLNEEVVYKKDLNKPAVMMSSMKKGNAPKQVRFRSEEDSSGKKRKIQYTPHPRKVGGRRHTHHRRLVSNRNITKKKRG